MVRQRVGHLPEERLAMVSECHVPREQLLELVEHEQERQRRFVGRLARRESLGLRQEPGGECIAQRELVHCHRWIGLKGEQRTLDEDVLRIHVLPTAPHTCDPDIAHERLDCLAPADHSRVAEQPRR